MLRAMKKEEWFAPRIESRKREMKIEKHEKKLIVNPPLKRRAIFVCPFKGAFGNSPAFQGWVEKFRKIQVFVGWAKSEAQPAMIAGFIGKENTCR